MGQKAAGFVKSARCPICITGTVQDGVCDGCLHGPRMDPPRPSRGGPLGMALQRQCVICYEPFPVQKGVNAWRVKTCSEKCQQVRRVRQERARVSA